MYVTEVMPLVKNAPTDTLSYYTSQKLAPGTLVTLPLRKKNVTALVVHQDAAPLSKLTLKAASFRLRKLPFQDNPPHIAQSVMNLAKTLTARVPYSLGTILTSLLPDEVLSGDYMLGDANATAVSATHQVNMLADTFEARIRAHKLTIRETLARHGSVLVVAPTQQEAAALFEVLKSGIEKRSIFLSPTRTKKQRAAAFTALNDTSNTKLIVATPQYLTINRSDILHIIIESSRSPHYTEKRQPYLNFKDVALLRAKEAGIPATIADLLPHTEDEWRRREGFYEPSDEALGRLSLPSTLRVVTPLKKVKKPFAPLYDKTIALLENAIKSKQHVFVYAARRGMAPMIVCADCGHIFRCPQSGAPYSLFKTFKNGEEQRWFVAASGTRIRAFDVCTECGSWRLQELGVGIQKIHEQLRSVFPDTDIIMFDHTTATTPRKRLQLLGEFYDAKSAILLGTSMALPYLTEPIDTAVVSSLEALRTNPTWRAEEDALSLLLTLRDKTTDTIIVQTKHEADEPLLAHAKSGQIAHFYSEELLLRQQLNYPPFSVFVHLMWRGERASVLETEALVTDALAPHVPRFYSSPTSTGEDTVRFALLRIDAASWPDSSLIEALRALPPYIRIEVNPARLV